MTQPFRTRQFLVFAASTAAAAGAVLLPTGAFAATPATTHTVVADSGPGNPGHNGSTLLLVVPEGSDDGRIIVKPEAHDGQGKDQSQGPGKHGPGKGNPGKSGGTDGGGVLDPPRDPIWICVAAPCGPPPQAQVVYT